MMTERHYDDETLIALMESKGDGSDPHVPTCETCAEKLESVRMIAETLKDEAVWNESSFSETPVPATISALRAAASRMEDEDAQAESVVRELLAEPRHSWRAKLDAHPEHQTAGLVRKLIAASNHAIDTMPVEAVEITTLAVDIAETLQGPGLSEGRLAQLHGAARRERSYALYYTGRFAEALAEADRAHSLFAKCMVDDYERARVEIVRALAFRALEQFTSGLAAARGAVRVFTEFSDLEKVVSGALAEVQLLFSLRDFAKAEAILSEQEIRLRSSDHSQTHARVLGNLAYAHWQQGRVAEALSFYDASSEILKEIGVETEALRARWGVATMLAEAGHRDDALRRLRSIAAEFEERGMACEAALADMGIAELLLLEEKFAEVEEICRGAMRSFELAGVSYSAKALTALAYLREATEARIVTPKLVRQVREYIRRLPSEENLLFAPPL